MQGGSQPHASGCSLEVGRGQRHTSDAVPGHCSLQAGLCMHCVWYIIEYQSTATGQHPRLWIENSIGSALHQPSLQLVHKDKWSSFGATRSKTVNALLSENLCLLLQSSTSCPAWICWNRLHEFDGTARELCLQAKWERGMTRLPTYTISLKVEAAMASAEIKF